MKTVIQENLIIRISKIIISFIFLLFLFISRKKDESSVFIILCTIVYITFFLLCFVSAFQKIEITNEKVIKSFIIPVKKIDRNLVADMNLKEKKDGTYDILFTMTNEKVIVLHIGIFFPIKEVIESLNNENISDSSEETRKNIEKNKNIFYAKIILSLLFSIIVAFLSILLIASLIYFKYFYLKIFILFICFGIIFLGIFTVLLKIMIK